MIGLTHCQCFEHLDKVVHVLASFFLTLLLRWALDLEPVAVAAVAVCVGGLDEMLQMFQPERNADPLDFLANVLGAFLACLMLRLCLHNKALLGENVTDSDFLV
ncbi:VanZ like family protein [Desulfomicrobium apsheronum]|uniref:VanZ like family protein n=1 Tax=Desulfomicrobium apsheronum TaxID=52560 RepID=A0A1I3UUV9_9BACT|nr:VanZ family protein [Desulfomicrobium apsheronum]SFJ86682.1 VanZ like family protein [Desulfomicrobium apsheronum]